MDWIEFKEYVNERVAEPSSEEGQVEIHEDGTHVAEIWEDGEITITKSGDLYRRRNLHQVVRPRLPEGFRLFEVPEDREHTRMVIVDDELRDEIEKMTVTIRQDSVTVELPEDNNGN